MFLEVAGKFHSTQPTLKAALACTKSGFVAPHLEVETYTWDVLPPELRQGNRADAIAREMNWVLEELALMAAVSQQTVSPKTLLRLGRVSNLPTVWTNVLAATVLAGGAWQNARTALVLVAMSLFYVGGMYLNDYFDRAIDARERPDRPIPAGEISANAVAAAGFAMLGAGVVLLAATGIAAAVCGLVLAGLVVAYDRFHKGINLSPVTMGLCRAFVYYGAAAAALGGVAWPIVLAGLALAAYVAGLTYAARQESLDRVGNLWPLVLLGAPMMLLAWPALEQGAAAIAIYLALIGWTAYAVYLLARRPMPGAVPKAVGALIAGISLVDATFLASIGAIMPAFVAVAGFAATMMLQRHIAGT